MFKNLRLFLAAIVAALIAACGGGDPPPAQVATPVAPVVVSPPVIVTAVNAATPEVSAMIGRITSDPEARDALASHSREIARVASLTGSQVPKLEAHAKAVINTRDFVDPICNLAEKSYVGLTEQMLRVRLASAPTPQMQETLISVENLAGPLDLMSSCPRLALQLNDHKFAQADPPVGPILPTETVRYVNGVMNDRNSIALSSHRIRSIAKVDRSIFVGEALSILSKGLWADIARAYDLTRMVDDVNWTAFYGTEIISDGTKRVSVSRDSIQLNPSGKYSAEYQLWLEDSRVAVKADIEAGRPTTLICHSLGNAFCALLAEKMVATSSNGVVTFIDPGYDVTKVQTINIASPILPAEQTYPTRAQTLLFGGDKIILTDALRGLFFPVTIKDAVNNAPSQDYVFAGSKANSTGDLLNHGFNEVYASYYLQATVYQASGLSCPVWSRRTMSEALLLAMQNAGMRHKQKDDWYTPLGCPRLSEALS